MTKRTPTAQAAVLECFRQLRGAGQFEPPSKEGTIVFPGFDGGLIVTASGLVFIGATNYDKMFAPATS